MKDEERTAVAGMVGRLGRRRRRRDDRLRHGHRQGRRALRLPLQPAQGARELCAGDRPRRTRRRAVGLRAARLPRRRAGARELRLRRHARAARRWRRCSTSCSRARRATSSWSPSTTSPPASTCARSCSRRCSPTSSSRACCGRARRSTPATACARSARPASSELFARFDAARARFLRRVIAAGKQGRVWVTLAPDAVAAALGEERSRVVSALGYLEDQGLVELQPAEPRQRYAVLAAARRPRSRWSTRWPRASSAASGPRSSASSACSRS